MDSDNIMLMTAAGEAVEFEKIAAIVLAGHLYMILSPVERLESMADDEALVFCVDGDQYALEMDDRIINQVFEQYEKLLNEHEG